jgi:C-terminal processing protease CtpA/Prc
MFKNTLSLGFGALFAVAMFVTLGVAAAGERSPEELKEYNLYLFKRVSYLLAAHLGNSDAPKAYRNAHQRWTQKEADLMEKVSSDNEELNQMINREISNLGLSHLAFSKLNEINLGIQFKSLGDGTAKIQHIDPHGPADEAGLKADDILVSINSRPASQALERPFRELTLNKVVLTRKEAAHSVAQSLSLELKVKNAFYYSGKVGITTENRPDGSLLVTQVQYGLPADQAGIKKWDQIIEIDGEPAVNQKAKGYKPYQPLNFWIARGKKKLKKRIVTPITLAETERPFYQEIKTSNGTAGYLKVPSLSDNYDPAIIQAAMLKAQAHSLLIVDLRNNRGGRADHFLSYLLRPRTLIGTIQGHSRLLPEDYSSSEFQFYSAVQEKAVPYRGNVAFIVNNHTYCAAEECALVPLEYYNLKKLSNAQNELYPRNIRAFGESGGALQVAGHEIIETPIGYFRLGFPAGEIRTPVFGENVENNGVQGLQPELKSVFKRDRKTGIASDPLIKLALQWHATIEKNGI